MQKNLLAAFAVAIMSASATAHSAEGAVFLRDAFTDYPAAGYRWDSGWSISGYVYRRNDDHAFGDDSATFFEAAIGRRSNLSEADGWRSFWDVDLGAGYAKVGDDDALNSMELGAWLGAEAFITPRLGLSARVGAVYAKRELSTHLTRTALDIGQAQVELAYYW